MAMSKRGGVAKDGKARRRWGFRPRPEGLETRALLAQVIDLVNVAGQTPGIGPYGVQEIGFQTTLGVGFSSALVGDVNGDGFTDMVVGAPSVIADTGRPTLGDGNGEAYLIFGSQRSDLTNTDWRTLVAQERIGDLSQIGNSSQTNPVNNQTGFPFNGVRFLSNQDPNNALGASVAAAGDVNGDGFADFLIGAPGARDANSNLPGIGRAYLIYGSPTIDNLTVNIIDLGADDPTNGPIRYLTFANAPEQALSQTGRSVANVGDVLADGFADLAIGAPLADLNGAVNNGAVYVISGGFLRSTPPITGVINLANVGQGGANNVPGVIFTGTDSDDRLGFSTSFGGDFNADGVGDILMGSVLANGGTGEVTLVYGSSGLINQGIVGGGFSNISLGRVLPGATNPIPGAVFLGENIADLTGFSVANGADFNGDGVSDILIGSPGWDGTGGTDSGRATLIYGTPDDITGVFSLTNLPSTISFAEFGGAGPFANLGFSMSALGSINGDGISEILLGAPGQSANRGVVYLLPGNREAFGIYQLNATGLQTLFATTINLGATPLPNYLGSSVAGQLFPIVPNERTIDNDNTSDFIVGAAGFSFGGTRVGAGTGYFLEGAFIPLETPVSTAISSNIGVNDVDPPFFINLSTDTAATFYILSGGSNTPGFTPPLEINPDTIRVNNVLLPDPNTFENAGDLDGDGIDDALFVFDPLSLLSLTPGNQTITVSARTFANQLYNGSATVQVRTTPPPPPGGGGTLPLTFGGAFQNRNLAAPQYGERFAPALPVVARSRWTGIAPRLAYRQFAPQGNFGYRMRNFFHPDVNMNKPKGGTRTLGREVFTRGRFAKGVHFGSIDHKGPVIGNGITYKQFLNQRNLNR